MTTTTLDRDLVRIECEYWDAVVAKDSVVATRLTADECVLVSPGGVRVVSPGAAGSMLRANEDWKLVSYDIADVMCTQIDNHNALLAYTVTAEYDFDGKKTKVTAHDATLWTWRNGQWVCALHCEAPAGDPFGRDRRAKSS